MERLYKGFQRFRQEYYQKEREFFKNLGHDQSPDVLFITCCDSRVNPNLITQSRPGELFVVRTVGNIIPTCETPWQKTSIGSAVEFALLVLKVPEIVICGHSDCGAVKALSKDEKELADMPNLKEWLEAVRPVKDTLCNISTPAYKDRLEKATKEHLLTQFNNLKTYDPVKKGLKAGKLNLHAWYYDIPEGEMSVYNARHNAFEKLRIDDEELSIETPGEAAEDIP